MAMSALPPKAHDMTSGTGELIDEFRILCEIGGTARMNDLAVIEYVRAIGDRKRQWHILLDKKN
jgi:hypothetical protein